MGDNLGQSNESLVESQGLLHEGREDTQWHLDVMREASKEECRSWVKESG